MRVALLGCNAQARNAIGNQVAQKLTFFRERGADVRVYLHFLDRLHPELRGCTRQAGEVAASGPVWDWLAHADLVIADYAQTYDLLHYLPLLVGRKPRLVLDYHGVTPAQHWDGPQRDLAERSARQRGIVWCADLALAHSQFAREELRRATGYPTERIIVAPYPTDITLFQPGPNQSLRSRLDFGAGPVLLSVGRLAASKRVSVLIESLPLLPDAHAVIVGDTLDVYGDEVRRGRELAERLDVAKRVHFLGQVDDRELAELYRGADVLVIPSLHEGYCLPAVEAMASGLAVIAARATALPETVGGAGLTFAPDDAEDLARQVRKVVYSLREWTATRGASRLPCEARRPLSRVAVVAFRFGSGIVGGAETSLRTMAQALHRAGQHVEVFTTCTNHECAWTNDLPAGTVMLDGMTVHRFPIDAHDRAAHHASLRRIEEANGCVDAAAEEAYLRHSIHSAPLIDALRQRRTDFDAIIVGPYLFGLTHDVAQAFPEQVLLLPCYHDEPFARLRAWQQAYTAVGGVLYHSPEEREFAQCELGLNHPRGVEVGTLIDMQPAPRTAVRGRTGRYIVYCGRYSLQKNVPMLLDFAERYERERPGRFQFVFLGQGEVRIPKAAWASDRGRVTEEDKRRVLAGAAALVQLSRQESLSLVALEAWAQATPVIVHADCAVLRGQVQRSQGGSTVSDYDAFARALDDLWERPDAWQSLGANGQKYVTKHYGSESDYCQRLLDAIDGLRIPWREHMRRRGLEQAVERSVPRWRERFGQIIERLLDAAPTAYRWDVGVRPQANGCRAAAGNRSVLVPVRVANHGSLPALADGPAATTLMADVLDLATGRLIGEPNQTRLPALVAPGQELPAALAVTLPSQPGQYQIVLYAAGAMANGHPPRQQVLPLDLGAGAVTANTAGVGSFLEVIQAELAEVHRLQRLPEDYLDVTEGRFARWKRWLKRKLLGNFKKAYIDVLSRQQSQVNQHLLLTMQQLADYCATLEHAVHGLQERLNERQPSELASPRTADRKQPAKETT